ncbi:hypothetical protein BH09SUM1_BH09SUM1_03860 [soil metagenome]
MVLPAELARMERDFLSGKNPLAYIPLCHALRRQKSFSRALEICQRGLAQDQNSVAGRALLARLLSDLGHYEDALREVAKAEIAAPDAMGLLTEKARCLLKLRRLEEAEVVLDKLSERNPLDPQVQLLSTQFRQLRSQHPAAGTHRGAEAVTTFMRLTSKEVLDAILKEMKGQATIYAAAVIPTRAGEPAVHGNPLPAEAAYEFWKETSISSQELDCGSMRVGMIETEQAQLIVLVRKNTLVALSIQPSQNFGRIFHRFQMAVGQLLPESLKQPNGAEE